ncbi:hypothetical protein HBB16_01790 [Pseudonocardia sp. MCCB 268]|nr:hypothetical protein [Pseudonocardia cytotoxica]
MSLDGAGLARPASTLLGMVEATGTFGINVLAAGQSDRAAIRDQGPGRFTACRTRAHDAARLDGIRSQWRARSPTSSRAATTASRWATSSRRRPRTSSR